MSSKQPVEGEYYTLTVKLLSRGTTHTIKNCIYNNDIWYRRRYYKSGEDEVDVNRELGWEPIPINSNEVSIMSWKKQPDISEDDQFA